MKTTRFYRPYGWKAKIGLIVPSTNTINEPEFYRLATPGISIHTARVLNSGPATQEAYDGMARGVMEAASLLRDSEVDVVAYGCTTGSVFCPLGELIGQMEKSVGVPAIATAGAVIAALRAINAKRIALVTPYIDAVNDREVAFLADYGFDVARIKGLDLGHTFEEKQDIGRVPPVALFQMARAVDTPDTDAIFISCTNLATLEVIAGIESELGKPVVTSNQATFWACLRLLGLRDSIPNHGRLLAQCLEPIDSSRFTATASVPAAL